MTIFNPEQYLNATMETPLEKRDPLLASGATPDGCYYATIKEVKARQWEGKTEKTAGKSGIAWDVQLEVDVPEAQRSTQGTDKRIVFDSIMLDLTEQGMIDAGKGKNGRLMMYREALDMNKPGDSFSALKMVGRPVKIKIDHRPYNNTVQEDVKSVLRAS